MDYVRFGRTGMKVSKLCLGCMTYGSSKWRDWVLDEEASRPFIREALEKGINFFDTADMYSVGASEEILGRAVKEFATRYEVVIATKVFNPMGPGPNAGGLSRKHIMEAIDASLKRLGTDYVDLYQIHRFDPDTPMEETVEALSDVVRAGKALYVGASSMWTWQFARMIAIARESRDAEFVSMQNFYNLVYREEEREMMKFCARSGNRGHSLVAAGARLSRRLRRWRGGFDRARADRRLLRSARPRLAPGRGDPPPGRRGGGEVRRQAGDRGVGLGSLQALRDRADRRRLQAASSRRRDRGLVAETRRQDDCAPRGAVSTQGGGRTRVRRRRYGARAKTAATAAGICRGVSINGSAPAAASSSASP